MRGAASKAAGDGRKASLVGRQRQSSKRPRRQSASFAALKPKELDKKELQGLRKQVAILYLSERGGLNALAASYHVTPQSCNHWVAKYRQKMPDAAVVSAVIQTYNERIAAQAAVSAAAAAASTSASSAASTASNSLAPTPERHVAAWREARKRFRDPRDKTNRADLAKELKEKHSLKSFSTGTVSAAAAADSVTPQPKGRPSFIPRAVETDLAATVRSIRSLSMPVFKTDIITMLEVAVEGIDEITMPQDLDHWYAGFLRRTGLTSMNLRPLDVTRAAWYTEENLEKHFMNVQRVLLKYGYAVVNTDFDAKVEESEPIYLTEEGKRMMFEFDESCFKVSDADVAAKSGGEKLVGDKDSEVDDGTSTVEHSCSARLSGVGGSFVCGIPLRPGFCFATGDSLDLDWMTDDEGRPITIPVVNPATGTHFEAAFDANPKGSYRVDSIIRYLSAVLEQSPKATEEKPLIGFLDGVYTHIHSDVVKWCVKRHIVLLLKVPYLSFCLQGQDVRGGQFSRIKPLWRKGLQVRLRTKRVRSLQESSNDPVSLSNEDFIPVLRKPWMDAFTTEINLSTWRTIGVSPFTRRPLWELRKKVAKAAAKKRRRESSASVAAAASTQLITALSTILGTDGGGGKKKKAKRTAGGEEAAAAFNPPKGKRPSASQVWNQCNGVATHSKYVQYCEGKEQEAAASAAEAEEKKLKATETKEKAAAEAKIRAEQHWVEYEKVNFDIDKLPRATLNIKPMVDVLRHKLLVTGKLPTGRDGILASLRQHMAKQGVVAAFQAGIAARPAASS